MPQLLLLNLFPFTLKIFPTVTTNTKGGKTENASVASPERFLFTLKISPTVTTNTKGGKTENAIVASPELVPIYPKDISNCYN